MKKNNTRKEIFILTILSMITLFSISFVSAAETETYTDFDARYVADIATATKLCIIKSNGEFPVVQGFGNPYAAAASWTGSVNVKYWDIANNKWVVKGSHEYMGNDPCKHPAIIRTLVCRKETENEISRLDRSNTINIPSSTLRAGGVLPKLPAETEFVSSMATAIKVCKLLGYSDAVGYIPRTWCNGANWELSWNGNQWITLPWAATSTMSYGHFNNLVCRKNITCFSNADCNDNNLRTEDICLNPGTGSSTCQNNNVRCAFNSDCGTDGFIGNLFCQGNGIFQNYNSFICSSPGTSQSSCSNSVTAMLKTSCSSGQICNNAQCITTQCSNGIDDDIDGLIDSQDTGCWDNINDPNTYNLLGNNEGKAGIQCFTNAQCGRDGFIGNKYCQNNSVYQDFKNFTCSNPGLGGAVCSSSTSQRNIQTCVKACSNGECIQVQCSTDGDCNDNDIYTIDVCNNAGTGQSSCSHTKVNCVSDNDCGINGFFGIEFCSDNNVFKNFKTSRCLSPGSLQSNCQVSDTPTLLLDCGENSCDSYGVHYCKEGNVYHQRTCNDKTCGNGICSSTFRAEESLVQTCSHGCLGGQCKPDCSTNADCSNGKICQNNVCVQVACSSNADCNDNNANTEDICLNSGTPQSVCQHNVVRCNADADCGTSRFLNQLVCSNGNVFDKYIVFMCHSPGTGTSMCMNHTEDRLVSNCINGCQDGYCVEGQCSVDSDCRADYVSLARYCINKSVYENFHDYSCLNSKCSENATSRFVETCSYGCRDGACREKTSGGVSDEDDVETTPLVLINKGSSDKGQIFGSVGSDINETALRLGTKPVIVENNYAYLWIIGFILLIIVLLIIVLILYFVLRD